MNDAYAVIYITPKITTQPVSVTVIAPAEAIVKVVASSFIPLKYQWMQSVNGKVYTKIKGATNASYSITATTTAESGIKYKCVVSNALGSVTSNAAVITVNPAVQAAGGNNNPICQAQSYQPLAPDVVETPINIPSSPSGTNLNYSVSCVGSYEGNPTVTATCNAGTWSVNFVDKCQPIQCVGPAPANATSCNGFPTQDGVYDYVTNASCGAGPCQYVCNVGYKFSQLGNDLGNCVTGACTGNLSANAVDCNQAPSTGSAAYVVTGNAGQCDEATPCQAVCASGYQLAPGTGICIVPGTSNVSPTVTIVSPANQGSFTTGSLSVTAMASENGGIIQNVAFYNGGTLLGEVTGTSQMFTYAWTNITAGTYNLTAVATDANGAQTASVPVMVTINSSNAIIDDNIAATTDARDNTTSYQYDNLNRLLKTTFADGATVSTAYDLFGNQISVTDQRGNTLTKTYDPYERLSQTKDPLGGITQFSYDTNGDLLTLTDANGHATTYSYDSDYRILTQTNALNLKTTFTYDPVGNIATRQDANGKTTNYTYDALNRLTNTVYPDNTSVVNVFDADGNKTSMTDMTGQARYSYDNDNRLLTKTDPAGNVIAYTYDGEGNRLTTVDQNKRVITNSYDALNRLATVQDQNGTTTYGYDANSNKLSVAMPNGVAENYTYDNSNRVLTAVNGNGLGVISSYANTYDVAGMITKKIFADGSWASYSYDALNRLLEETKQNTGGIIYDYVYTYDPVGNRLTWNNNGTLRSYNYDVVNRLTNWSYTFNSTMQTDSYTYDNNGNRLTKQVVLTGQDNSSQQTTYTYDFENRLQGLSIPDASAGSPDAVSYIYSGEGLRVQSLLNNAATGYLYDGSNVLLETNGTSTTKTYTRGLDSGGGIGSLIAQNFTVNNTPTAQYYDYNDLGSASDLTSSAGASASNYTYDAFGNLLAPQASEDTNRYLFSTKEFDARSGLYYFGGRYYDPEIGRWLTPDPLGFVNGPNMYAYVDNNPINEIDPYGLFSWNRGWREAIKGVVKGGTAGWLLGQFGGPLVPYTGPEGAGLGALLGGAGGFINGAWADENPVVANALGTSLQGAVGGPAGAVIGGIGGAVGGLTSCPERNTPDNAGLNGIISGVAGGLVSGPGGAIESGGQGVIDGYIDGFINYLEGRNTNKSAQ